MPRKPRVPAYRHFKPRDLAFVRLNGRNVYLGKFDSTESHAEYNRVIAEWLVNKQAPPATTAEHELPMIDVAGLVDAYWKHALEYYGDDKRGTAYNLKPTIDSLRELYGDLPAREFGPLRLKALQQHWIEKKHSRGYVNDQTGVVKRLFKWAASCELIPTIVHQSLTTVSGLRRGRTKAREGRKIRPVDDSTVNETVKHLTPVLTAMVMVQRLTGARPGEICRMRPIDIDRSDDVWLYRPSRHKTENHGIERIIPIGPKSQAYLLPFLLRDAAAPCFSPAESERQRLDALHAQRRTPMSCGNRPKRHDDRKLGLFYTPLTYCRAIQRVTKREKLPKWSPNQLRHSRATEVRRELGYEAARTVLGHESDVTKIYAERNFELAKRAALLSG